MSLGTTSQRNAPEARRGALAQRAGRASGGRNMNEVRGGAGRELEWPPSGAERSALREVCSRLYERAARRDPRDRDASRRATLVTNAPVARGAYSPRSRYCRRLPGATRPAERSLSATHQHPQVPRDFTQISIEPRQRTHFH